MSGRKMVMHQAQVLANVSMASSGTVYTPPINVQYLDNVGIQMIWNPTVVGGAVSGTLRVDASSDYIALQTISTSASSAPVVQSSTSHWTQYVGSTAITPALASSGSALIDLNQCPYPWVRVAFVSTSGTGLLNAWVHSKQV